MQWRDVPDAYLPHKVQERLPEIADRISSNPVLRQHAASTTDHMGKTLAHQAALHGELPLLEILYQENPALISQAESHGFTCAHGAAQRGHLHILKWLASKDASLISKGTDLGITPMHSAAGQGKLNVVKWLYSMDEESIRRPDGNGWMPTHTAAANYRIEVLDWLWTKDQAALSLQNRQGRTPVQEVLFCHYDRHNAIDVVKWFVRKDPSLLEGLEDFAREAKQTQVLQWIQSTRRIRQASDAASESKPKGSSSEGALQSDRCALICPNCPSPNLPDLCSAGPGGPGRTDCPAPPPRTRQPRAGMQRRARLR